MDLFRRIGPGETVPPPPGWVLEWTTQSLSGLCGGLAWGGYRGLLLARETGISATPKKTATNYFVKGALWGGSRVGLFAATFSAVTLASEHYRSKRDAYNYAGAGAFSATLFTNGAGLTVCVPAALAASVCGGALGYLQIGLENRVGGKLFETQPLPVEAPSVALEDIEALVSGMEQELSEASKLISKSTPEKEK